MSDTKIKEVMNVLNFFNQGESACDYAFNESLIRSFVNQNKKIKSVILAFPGKTSNPDSVNDYLPDGGEALAVKTLNSICEKVKEIYEPGIEINIIHDGYYFAKLGLVKTYDKLDGYINKISKSLNQKYIKSYKIDDIFKGLSREKQIEIFDKEYCSKKEEIEKKKRNKEFCKYYSKISSFMYHEYSEHFWKGNSRQFKQNKSKDLAIKYMQITSGLDKIVSQNFSDCVRFSIHKQHNEKSKKFYINLLPNIECSKSPWMNILVNEGGKLVLRKYKDVDLNMAKIVEFDAV